MTAAASRRALLVLTRDPTGEQSGRKAVLATIARSLEANGLLVDVVVLARSVPSASWEGRSVSRVALPALPSIAAGAVRATARRDRALNEALFDARRVRREVREVARRVGADLVVADTLRTAGPAIATGLPVVVHLDDLLSDRYRDLAAASGGTDDLLGFFGEQLPPALRRPAGRLAGRLLGREAALVHAREIELARDVAAVAMTSPAEAAELSRRCGRPVATLPMAVDVRAAADVAGAPAPSMVFVGGMGYAPNAAAVRWWRDEVRPVLDATGGQDVTLTVVGSCSDRLRAELADERLRFTGDVDDLADELRRHRAMLAPVTAGTGMKTKVLDGFSVGLPVVATSLGVAGLGVVDGREALVADAPEQFAARVLRVRDDAAAAADVGAAGRALLASTWSSATLVEGWRSVLDTVLPAPGR